MTPILIDKIENLQLIRERSPYTHIVHAGCIIDLNDAKFLDDTISCIITEERNGTYELKMTYSIDGKWFSDISVDKFIVAKSNASGRAQPFRIYKVTSMLNGRMTIFAEHMSYIYRDVPIIRTPYADVDNLDNYAVNSIEWLLHQAIVGVKDNWDAETPVVDFPLPIDADDWSYMYKSDVSNESTSSVWNPAQPPSSLKEYLIGRQGSVLQFFGGEYQFDWTSVYLLENRGEDNGVTFIYGKNISNATQTIDMSNVYTGILPFWYGFVNQGDDKETLVYLTNAPETSDEFIDFPEVVFADNHESFGYERVVCVDFTDKFEKPPSWAELRDIAVSYVEENKISEPDVTIDVSFVTSARESDDIIEKKFEQIQLCDIVTIVVPQFNVNIKAKVVKTVYDCLLEKYESISVGTIKKTFPQSIVERIDTVKADTKSGIVANARDISLLQSFYDGEQINLSGSNFIGFLTNGKQRVQFSIPVSKGFSGIDKAEISGTFIIRNSDGGYIGVTAGQTLQSLGTVNVYISGSAVWVRLDLASASSFVNNTVVVVQGTGNSRLTFKKNVQ